MRELTARLRALAAEVDHHAATCPECGRNFGECEEGESLSGRLLVLLDDLAQRRAEFIEDLDTCASIVEDLRAGLALD